METQHPRVVELGRGRSITYPPLGTKLGSRVPFLIRVPRVGNSVQSTEYLLDGRV